MTGPARLDSLTSLRFFAALAVVLYHGGYLVWRAAYPPVSLGYTGVSFFFVLSGFVLTWSSQESLPVLRFWRNRLARIYPLHVVTWIFAVIVLTGVHPGSLAALGLVQAWSPRPETFGAGDGASWSLSCEAFFYLVFPWVAAWSGRRRLIGRSLLGVFVVYATYGLVVFMTLGTWSAYWAGYVLPGYRLAEFTAGCLIARALQRGWRPPWSPFQASVFTLSLFGVLTAGGFGYQERFGGADMLLADILMAPAFCALIAAVASSDLSTEPWLAHRVTVRLGRESFALYLVHFLVASWLLQAGDQGPWWAGVYLVVSLIAAMALHRWVEVPAEAFIRSAPWSNLTRGRATTPLPRQVP